MMTAMTLSVVEAEETAMATIESPLSDDDMDADSNSLARYFRDGDREGPESGNADAQHPSSAKTTLRSAAARNSAMNPP